MYPPEDQREYMLLDGNPRFSVQGLSNALADVGEGMDETPAEEHVQVDGPGTAYLFSYDKQGHQGLGQDTTHVIWADMEEDFSEWISCSAHFTISLFSLMEAWQ